MEDFEKEIEKKKEILLDAVSKVISDYIFVSRKTIKIFDIGKFVFWINLKDAIYFVFRTSRELLYELVEYNPVNDYLCVTPLEVRYNKKRISVDICHNNKLGETEVYIYENSNLVAHFYPEKKNDKMAIQSKHT